MPNTPPGPLPIQCSTHGEVLPDMSLLGPLCPKCAAAPRTERKRSPPSEAEEWIDALITSSQPK